MYGVVSITELTHSPIKKTQVYIDSYLINSSLSFFLSLFQTSENPLNEANFELFTDTVTYYDL